MKNQNLALFDGTAPIRLYATPTLTEFMFYDENMKPLGETPKTESLQAMVHAIFANHASVDYRVNWDIEWQEDNKRWQLDYLPRRK